MKNAEGFFPLSPRGTSGERAGERGKCDENALLSPALSSFFGEEREKRSAAGLQANDLAHSIGAGRLDKPGDQLSIFLTMMQIARCFQSAVDLLFPCRSLFLQRFAETARCL